MSYNPQLASGKVLENSNWVLVSKKVFTNAAPSASVVNTFQLTHSGGGFTGKIKVYKKY